MDNLSISPSLSQAPRRKKKKVSKSSVVLLFAVGATCIYVLSHSLILYHHNDNDDNDFVTPQLALRRQFTTDHSNKLGAKNIIQQIRKRRQQQQLLDESSAGETDEVDSRGAEGGETDEVDRGAEGGETDEVDREEDESNAQEAEEQDEVGVEEEDVDVHEEEEEEEISQEDEAPQEEAEEQHSVLSNKLFSSLNRKKTKISTAQRLRDNNLGLRGMGNQSLTHAKLGSLSFFHLEDGVKPTKEDPDGLKQRLKIRWDTAECLYNQTLLPPKIELDQPLILPIREDQSSRPHMGILLDAARHFLPLEWLYGLVDFLAVLGYDMIHFRLTDDQSFIVQLDCHPQLATAAHFNRKNEFYTAQELRDFVQYSKERGISIMPEVNVPGHAGGWSGIPGLVYPCTNFICGTGYSIPLRIDQPKVLQVIEDVLKEVLDIFSTAKYLHLGGDEIWMSEPCFNELQMRPDFQAFENSLGEILERLNFSPDKVARWEATGGGNRDLSALLRPKEAHIRRAGGMTHWWFKVPTEKKDLNKPLFISSDLYFDASGDRDAWDIFNVSAAHYALNPVAVIAATFELGPCSFDTRNVWGKLVAVAMATRKEFSDEKEAFMMDYQQVCRGMGLSVTLCELEGRPAILTSDWKPSHNILQKAWAATVCDRLTYSAKTFSMRKKDAAPHHDDGMHSFVAEQRAKEFRREIEKTRAAQTFTSAKDPIYQHIYNHTGVMVDLAHDYFPIERLQHIIDVMSMLGFNLLHVRLIENDFFPMELLEYAGLKIPAKENGNYYYTEGDLKALVNYASERGVSIMPEINFLSNAGGWQQSGLLVGCPRHICDVGGPLPMDVNKGRAISTVSIVCGVLLQIFSTSPFLHVGSVDQETAEPCYREAYPLGDFDLSKTFGDFEVAMLGVFENMGVANTRIVTWESPGDHVLGGITHFSQTTPVEGSVAGKFLLSADASLEAIGEDNAWDIYQHTRFSRNAGATGVIVGTNGIDSDAWESQNVLGRLIAVAAGLSTFEGMDEAEFQSHYATTCSKVVGFSPATCNSFGKPVTSSADWETERDSREKELQITKCKRFTHERRDRLPKE
jgi:hypothetical protein